MRLGVVAAIVVVVAWGAWWARGEVDARQNADVLLEAGLQAVRERLAGLETEVATLRALVLSERRLGDAAIEAAIRRLADARDYTRERNPRPRVDAVQRELYRAGVELRVDATARDRVWTTMPLTDRLDLLAALDRGHPAARREETPP